MEITVKQQDGYVTLAPQGDLDANSSIQMDEGIRVQLEQGNTRLHIDCGGLNYISSAGLGVFISFLDEIRGQGGDIAFSGMSEKIYKVFELLGLHQVMTIKPTEEEATKALKG
jgi:anti-sigma B factor antagonist